MTDHRVLLIRPWNYSDGVGAGCCSGGSTKGLCSDSQHHHEAHDGHGERDDWNPLAGIYLALRQALPSNVDVEIVDPRNHLYLIPTLTSAARERGQGWPGALMSALRGPAYAAIIVDGVTVSSGEVPEPSEAVQRVLESLGTAASPR